MSKSFRVVDFRQNLAGADCAPVVDVATPEQAVRQAIGEDLVRSGVKGEFVAKVYFQNGDSPMNMVRFYRKVEYDPGRSKRKVVSNH
jgi:hypothetical protein